MARIARVVVPGYPHHVTQRGNRRQQTFFREEDYQLYLNLMSEWCGKYSVAIWAYCLMPNHVHLIAVPSDAAGLRLAIGEAHRRYTRHINLRNGWQGHLWQERFASFPMQERHLLAAAKYIERNPVAAAIVQSAGDYLWSSAKRHLYGRKDTLVRSCVLDEIVGDWEKFLAKPVSPSEIKELQEHGSTGRPLGSEDFVKKMELELGRVLHKRKPGRKSLAVN